MNLLKCSQVAFLYLFRMIYNLFIGTGVFLFVLQSRRFTMKYDKTE